MSIRTVSTLLTPLCLALAVAASAAEPESSAPANARPATEKSVVAAQPAQPAPHTPMALEIDALLDAARSTVAVLQEQFENATNDKTAVDLIRQIEEAKKNAELDILRVQLKYARAEGRTALAAELTAALTRMTTPPAQSVPVDRAAPDADHH